MRVFDILRVRQIYPPTLLRFFTGTVHLVDFSEKTSQGLAELQVFALHL
jgi:hypothetical protein